MINTIKIPKQVTEETEVQLPYFFKYYNTYHGVYTDKHEVRAYAEKDGTFNIASYTNLTVRIPSDVTEITEAEFLAKVDKCLELAKGDFIPNMEVCNDNI